MSRARWLVLALFGCGGGFAGRTRAPRTVAIVVFAALAAGRWDFH